MEIRTPIYQWRVASLPPHDILRRVWDRTPWIVEVRLWNDSDLVQAAISRHGDQMIARLAMVRAWCAPRWGDEARLRPGDKGQWQIRRHIIAGWAWIGFATEEQMTEFRAVWPTRLDDRGETAR